MEKINQGFKEFAAKAQQLVREQQQKLASQRELPGTRGFVRLSDLWSVQEQVQ